MKRKKAVGGRLGLLESLPFFLNLFALGSVDVGFFLYKEFHTLNQKHSQTQTSFAKQEKWGIYLSAGFFLLISAGFSTT